MLDRNDYYKHHEKNAANSDDLLLQSSSLFPQEGVLIGDFVTPTGEKAPALIPIDQTNGVCFLSTPDNEKEIKQVMQMMALRLACSIPPLKCKMLLYDGQGEGGELIELSELSASIIGKSIVTNLAEFKDKLKSIKQDITHTIQKVLGAKYANQTLVEYNKSADTLSQPYTFIIIADFPHKIDKEAADLLLQIVKNGRRAGVFVIMNLDTSVGLTQETQDFYNHIEQKPFLDSMTIIYQSNNRFYIKNLLTKNPNEELLNHFALRLDSSAIDKDIVREQINKRVEYAKKNPAKLSIASLFTQDNLWKQSAGECVEIPIGKSNDRTIQYFRLGIDHHHCLIGGTSGSGKSVFLHNIICNGSWLYSPDELQFFLLDFKEGVEFNDYKDFSNVKVLSVQSDTAFALNVFQFLNNEMNERAKIFRGMGARNLKDYNQRAEKRLPRYVVIIDEFQKMFSSNYRTTTELNAEIENITKQGRSFGVNLILCTQSLGGLDIKLSEISLRIGLQFFDESACRRICYDNTIPLGLEKGQALYCSNSTGKDAVQFRVAYIDDKEIPEIQKSIIKSGISYSPFDRYFFDGETPANYNDLVRAKDAGEKAIYIGSPWALKKEHSYYTFKREQGSNLLIVGEDVIAATSIVYHTIQQILMTASRKDAIIICDKTSEDSPTLGKLSELSGAEMCNYLYLKSDNDITTWVNSINQKVKERNSGEIENYGEIYFILFNTFNYRPARWKEELEPKESRQLSEILKDGSNYGIHMIVYSDTYNHYLETFRKKYQYEWGIKAAIKGGDSTAIFEKEERIIKSEYESLFIKDSLRDDQADKIMVYKL